MLSGQIPTRQWNTRRSEKARRLASVPVQGKVQLSLLIAGVAWAHELERRGVSPDIVSGLSIGAYPAAVVAGAARFPASASRACRRATVPDQYRRLYGTLPARAPSPA